MFSPTKYYDGPKLPTEKIAILKNWNNRILLVAIDDKPCGNIWDGMGGRRGHFSIHLLPGKHRLKVSYFLAQADEILINYEFKAGGKYRLMCSIDITNSKGQTSSGTWTAWVKKIK